MPICNISNILNIDDIAIFKTGNVKSKNFGIFFRDENFLGENFGKFFENLKISQKFSNLKI